MKNFFLLLILVISNCITAQTLPSLPLGNLDFKDVVTREVALDKNEICVILITNVGATAFDERTYYTFRKNGQVEAYKEQTPKTYLQSTDLKTSGEKLILSAEAQKYFFDCLNAKITLNFLTYSQSDFVVKTNERPNVTSLLNSHGNTYEIAFIQNNHIKSYSSYEPRQQFRTSDPTINKIVLAKFIKLLELWNLLKT
jgi:hypothetical protein